MEEKQDRLPRPLRLMQVFREAFLHCGLVDLGLRGNIFTWRNGCLGDDFVQLVNGKPSFLMPKLLISRHPIQITCLFSYQQWNQPILRGGRSCQGVSKGSGPLIQIVKE